MNNSIIQSFSKKIFSTFFTLTLLGSSLSFSSDRVPTLDCELKKAELQNALTKQVYFKPEEMPILKSDLNNISNAFATENVENRGIEYKIEGYKKYLQIISTLMYFETEEKNKQMIIKATYRLNSYNFYTLNIDEIFDVVDPKTYAPIVKSKQYNIQNNYTNYQSTAFNCIQ